MSGLAHRYKQKNDFIAICRRKNCNEPIYMSEKIASEKRLCLKHYDLFIEKHFKSISQPNKNNICKICGEEIENKRNKLYCSVECRQQASRKIKTNSIEKLVKSLEWQKVERLIKSSPLGLNSINHSENLDDLYRLFILCHFEIKSKRNNTGFTFQHIIPVRFGGQNTLDNIIIVPAFIKRSMNLSLVGASNLIKGKKSIYIKNNIVDTCLNNKNLKDKMVKLIEKINLTFDVNTEEKLTEKEYDSIKNESSFINSIRALFLFRLNTYLPDSLLNHLKIQLYLIKKTINIKPFNYLINWFEKLDTNQFVRDIDRKDIFNILPLFFYSVVLNYDKKDSILSRRENINLLLSLIGDCPEQSQLNQLNQILFRNIIFLIKFNFKKDIPENKRANYSFMNNLYERYVKK
ncbi:hypothetical protein [Orbus mooreae]|uniref:hypothetical protein n=1 Tax=Orbus mooreae TaxID=3074107 RepID=UPI00370D0747